ncbi:MAG TPA: hypothetical protein VF680_08070 [Allosphingosinicella sp.]
MLRTFAIWLLVVVPAVIVAVILTYAPRVITGNQDLNSSFILSLVGAALSYYGVLFSLYAALEVRNISKRYLFKLRSPDILKKLRKISKAVNAIASEPSRNLHAQSFFHELPVVVRASKRLSSTEVKRVAREVDRALHLLIKQGIPNSPNNITAGEVRGYWDLFQKISELADEMNEQIENARATE